MIHYDVSVDGRRFLALKASGEGTGASGLAAVHNWEAELERLAPTEQEETN